jgi:hypothetical protein
MGLNIDNELVPEIIKKLEKISGFDNIKVVNL